MLRVSTIAIVARSAFIFCNILDFIIWAIATLVTSDTGRTKNTRLECPWRTSYCTSILLGYPSWQCWSIITKEIFRFVLNAIKILNLWVGRPTSFSAEVSLLISTITNSAIVIIILCWPAILARWTECAGLLVFNKISNRTFFRRDTALWAIVVIIFVCTRNWRNYTNCRAVTSNVTNPTFISTFIRHVGPGSTNKRLVRPSWAVMTKWTNCPHIVFVYATKTIVPGRTILDVF